MAKVMDSLTVQEALKRLGTALDVPGDVEILLVGGAAAMLTGVLPPSRTTTDCDVINYEPKQAMARVETAAERVAGELDLSPNWLNSDVQLRADTLPDGWEERRIHVGTYGRLSVWAASRPDLIAMKVVAGRDQDIEDLVAMRVRRDEIPFIETYLSRLGSKGTSPEQIREAKALLEALEVHDHD